MFVLVGSRVTMTTELSPPVHWYLTVDHVVYAMSKELLVFGNQAVIDNVGPRNLGGF